MNRIERIIEEIQGKIDAYKEKYPEEAKDDLWVIPRWEKQLEFYNWLLEDSDEVPVYELHDERVRPTVWGMGDVTFNISIQLNKMDARSSPKVLIFDYRSSASTGKEEP
ncbi:unnamed protein product [marine sediment metagenome]|uniref:Uncharacterized protein n=1 Tax=marine sediment metagenome TaxID=412755 RepID=X1LKQ2_9ZZZZ